MIRRSLVKKYLTRLISQSTTVIEVNGARFVEIAKERPTPIFLSEKLWLRYIEPFEKDKGMQDTQLSSILNGFDYAAFQWKQHLSEESLLFHVQLLVLYCCEMRAVKLRASVWMFKPLQTAVFLSAVSGPLESAENVVSLEVGKSESIP